MNDFIQTFICNGCTRPCVLEVKFDGDVDLPVIKPFSCPFEYNREGNDSNWKIEIKESEK